MIRLPVVFAAVAAGCVGFAGVPADALTVGHPAIASLGRAYGSTAGGDRVTVHGDFLSHVERVRFGTAFGHGLHVVGSHAITVDTPRHAVGMVNVRVSGPGGISAILARLGYCGDLGASNGTRTVQRTRPLTDVIAPDNGFDISFPEYVLPAP